VKDRFNSNFLGCPSALRFTNNVCSSFQSEKRLKLNRPLLAPILSEGFVKERDLLIIPVSNQLIDAIK